MNKLNITNKQNFSLALESFTEFAFDLEGLTYHVYDSSEADFGYDIYPPTTNIDMVLEEGLDEAIDGGVWNGDTEGMFDFMTFDNDYLKQLI